MFSISMFGCLCCVILIQHKQNEHVKKLHSLYVHSNALHIYIHTFSFTFSFTFSISFSVSFNICFV